jgi:ferredoxin
MSIIIDDEKCKGCGVCVSVCPSVALSIFDNIAVIDHNLCNECLQCMDECPNNAIYQILEEGASVLPRNSNTPELTSHKTAQSKPMKSSHPQKHHAIETAAMVLGGLTKLASPFLKDYLSLGGRNRGKGKSKRGRRRHGKW